MAAFVALGMIFGAAAQEVDLTDVSKTIKFPEDFNLGKWYDAKWDAYWELQSDNISLYKGDAKIVSFAGTIKNWNMSVSARGSEITCGCDAASR